MSKNAIWKNFDHTHGPLPLKASEYLKLKKDIERLEYNAKQKRTLNELLGDERGMVMDPRDRTQLMQKRGQMQVLETELRNNNYLYRNSNHMATVWDYIFPQEKEESKKQSPEPIRPAVAAPAAPVQQKPAAVAAPPKPSNDAWDLY
jgi:hypothetical protein